MSTPKIFIIAGPNGAGKTTFALETTLSGLGYARQTSQAKPQ